MKPPLKIGAELRPGMMALRVAAAYALLGWLWIIVSDRVLVALGLPSRQEELFGTAKGVVFVLVTAAVVFALSRAGFSRVQHATAALLGEEARIREAYVEVLDAVTGGKLVIVTEDEMADEYGRALTPLEPVDSPAQLAYVRSKIRSVAETVVSSQIASRALNAAGEALNNALKHVGAGEYEVLTRDGTLQVRVSDRGPGIDFRLLPKATLLPGFSTTQTRGMGFTIMLQLSERVLICTEPGSTTVMLEFAK